MNSTRFRGGFDFAIGLPDRALHFSTDMNTPPVSSIRSNQPVAILSFVVSNTVPVSS